MFGNIPPFFANGQPSTNTNTLNFTGGAWTFTKSAQASTAETIVTFSVADDTTSKIIFKNNTTSDSAASLMIQGIGSTTQRGLIISGAITTDTGTNAALVFDARTAADAVVVTRPIFQWRNFGTAVMAMSAAGGLSITGGSAPSLTLGASGTAITQMRVYTPTIDPASVAANTTAEQTFTVSGLTTADKVIVNKPTSTAGLGIVNVRVSAADTLAITFGNFTGIAIDPASEVYSVIAIRS